MGRHAENAREAIIDAAEDVVIEVGARHLTIETVAKKAGVSRGGLFYHFPNKEALLHAMLDRRITRTEESRRAMLREGSRSELAAHVLSSIEEAPRIKKLSVALFAAAAYDPQLLLPYRGEYRRMLDKFIGEGLRPARAATVMLAVDGLRLMELLSLTPFTAEERNAVVEEILALSMDETHD